MRPSGPGFSPQWGRSVCRQPHRRRLLYRSRRGKWRASSHPARRYSITIQSIGREECNQIFHGVIQPAPDALCRPFQPTSRSAADPILAGLGADSPCLFCPLLSGDRGDDLPRPSPGFPFACGQSFHLCNALRDLCFTCAKIRVGLAAAVGRQGRAALARLGYKGLAELEKWWDGAEQDGR